MTTDRDGHTRPIDAPITFPAAVDGPIMLSIAVVVVIGLTVGCGSGGTSSGDVEGLSVTRTWARPTPSGNDRTAIYATVGNNGSAADRLTGVMTDRCSMTELHTTVIDDDGVAAMRPPDEEALTVAPGADLVLEPGGLHVMCMGVTAPLAEGDRFDAAFTFESGSTVEVEIEVAPQP